MINAEAEASNKGKKIWRLPVPAMTQISADATANLMPRNFLEPIALFCQGSKAEKSHAAQIIKEWVQSPDAQCAFAREDV